MTLWVLISGTSLGPYFVYIRVLFRTFSVCAVCLENVDFPPFSHEKRASSIALKTPDPLHAMEMRYQLRHSPKVCPANFV